MKDKFGTRQNLLSKQKFSRVIYLAKYQTNQMIMAQLSMEIPLNRAFIDNKYDYLHDVNFLRQSCQLR